MDNIDRINWSFADDEWLEEIWDRAREIFFEEDEPLLPSFKQAVDEIPWWSARQKGIK